MASPVDDLSSAADPGALIVAFYLPQFHPIPENDTWWGRGFTEWTNVRKARPLYPGHMQPRVPSDLGYYDLRDIEVHHAQAALARRYGVSAFCYYAYWFNGRRLLEEPLRLVKSNPDIGMPYAICWANEPWTRRWDGGDHQVLMEQRHSPESDAAFVNDIAEHLSDPRYVRIGGKPLLLIYRAELLDDPLRTTDGLRERAERLGLGELHLGMMQTFGQWDPIAFGFDAAVEFPPHGVIPSNIEAKLRKSTTRADSSVATASYTDAVSVSLSRPEPPFPWFRAVMPAWDNTPRRGKSGIAYLGASPLEFSRWFEEAVRWTYLFRPPGERVVFINAWNEWAEGAYLEPDSLYHHGYLEAVQAVLARTRPFAIETATLQTRGGDGGLLDYARRPWRERKAADPALAPFGMSTAGTVGDGDSESEWAIKASLWALGKIRRIPPAHFAVRETARVLRRIRRKWVRR